MKWAKLVLAFLVVSSSVVLWCRPAMADPLVPSMSLATEWLAGPANASLGTLAGIRVPQGYKFTDAPGARAFLERMTNPVPKNLLGILAPESGSWWVVLEFADLGFVKDEDKDQINPSEILKTLSRQPKLAGADWELKPQYDPADHTLEWAVRAQSQPQPLVSHIVRILGRHGALDALVVRPYRGFSDLAPLKQLVKGIVFKTGEHYADFQNGDPIAASGLVALVTGDDRLSKFAVASVPTTTVTAGKAAKTPWLWVGLGLVICVGLVPGIRFARKLPRKTPSASRTNSASAPASRPLQTIAEAFPLRQISKPAPSPAGSKLASPALGKATNGKHHGGHRKKVFDYNRYFTDLMSSVSSHSNQVDAAPVNGYALDSGRFAAPAPPSQFAPLAPTAVMSANSEMIAHQKTLIEEQKHLIQEQTKLIEEKTQLIAEKNQLLRMQSEFMEQKLL